MEDWRGKVSDQSYQLVMQRGPNNGRMYPLVTRTVMIGRDPIADIVIIDPEVSRQHVRLTQREEGGYQIQDLGSTNGSFINGQRLGGDFWVLQEGQHIMLGSGVVLIYTAVTLPNSLPAAPPEPLTDTTPPASEVHTDASLSPLPDDSIAELLAEFSQVDKPEQPVSPTITPAPASAAARPQAQDLLPPRPYTEAPPLRAPAPPLVASEATPPPRRRTVIWVVVGLLILICGCLAFALSAWYIWGDPLMHAMGVY